MNKRVVVAIAGSAGLAVVVASAAALAFTLNPSPVASVAVMTQHPAETQAQKQVQRHPRLAAEETVASSVLVVPTIVIYGEAPRRGVAEKQGPATSAANLDK